MDDAQKIDHLIDVMKQLQELEKVLARKHNFDIAVLSMILAIIHDTPLPDVTILPNNRDIAYA